MLPLWIFLIALTALRIVVASWGHLSETEAYLALCAQHLDWGFVDQSAGIPALMRLSATLFGWTPFGIRFFSPVMMLVASLSLAHLATSLRGKKTAYWSVIAFNLLPLTNAAVLVMDGTVVVAAFWILALSAAWRVLTHEKKSGASWIFFGLLLAVGTQFAYSIGLLLLVVLLWEFLIDGKCRCYAGVGLVLFFLGLTWSGPLYWNAHNDWLGWRGMTWDAFWIGTFPVLEWCSPFFWNALLMLLLMVLGVADFFPSRHSSRKETVEKKSAFLVLLVLPFLVYLFELTHRKPYFSLLLALFALLLPGIVSFFLKKTVLKKSALPFLLLAGIVSLVLPSGIFSSINNFFFSWSISGVRGVTGLQPVAVEILRWRTSQQDELGRLPFVIAQTPGLAALLGSVLPITYSELPGAPSVFVPESPSFTSQFQLWPHYADATASAVVDPLYTEEQVTSPFLDHDALYISPENLEEVPQTIHGAFASVEPLGEATLDNDGRAEHLFIYHCKKYQMLSL